jgi:hypothetical protein
MTAERLQQLIDGITEDIRMYSRELGWLVLFDPTTEAYHLCEVRFKLEQELGRLRDWRCGLASYQGE